MNNRRSKQLRQKQMLLRVIVLAYLTCASADICPNACSGHGTCQSSSTSIDVTSDTAVTTAAVCTCDTGYLFPDCSGLACPTGLPWFSAATADGTARGAVQECSGIGLCDYKTGLCTCPTIALPDRKPAALGHACQRLPCPTTKEAFECSGHGVCMSMGHAAQKWGPPQNSDTSIRKDEGPVYSNWEQHKRSGCVCNFGWTGSMCHLKLCPKGDDPRTTSQSNTIIRIVTSGTSGTQIQGYFTFHFLGFTAQLRANSLKDLSGNANTFSNANCVSFITSLTNVVSATCSISNADSNTGGARYDITLTGYPVMPLETPYFHHTGAPSADQMGCSMDDITTGASVTCLVTVQQVGTKEYAPCSNRGNCDFLTGKCVCHPFFYGTACEQQGVLNNDVHTRTALLLDATDNSYSGSLLQGHIKKSEAPDFFPMSMTSGSAIVFAVDGTNNINAGGAVSADGLVISSGGGNFSQKIDNVDVLKLFSTHSSFSNDLVQVWPTATNAAKTWNFLKYKAEAVKGVPTDQLTILGDGQIISGCEQDPTSSSEGCLVTAGGIGIAGAMYSGGNIVSEDLTDSTTILTGSIITPGGVGVGLRAAMGSLEVLNAEQKSTGTSFANIYSDNATHYVGTVAMIETLTVQTTINSDSNPWANFNLIKCNINKDNTPVEKFAVDGHGYMQSQAGMLLGGVRDLLLYTVTLSSGTTVNEFGDVYSGVAVTQGTGGSLIRGILWETVSGSITSFIIIAVTGLTWASDANIIVGGTTVAHAKISSVVAQGNHLSGEEPGGLKIDAGGWTVGNGNVAINGDVLFTSSSAQTWDHTGANTNNPTTGANPMTFSTHNSGKIKIVGDSTGTLTIGNRDGGQTVYSGSLGLKGATPIRFDGSDVSGNKWLSIALAGDPTATHTITLPVIYTATVLSSASIGSSVLNTLGTLTGLAVTSSATLSTTTAVTLAKNTLTTGFVGNLLQLDTAMSSASSAYNIILARSDTGGTPATKFKVDGTGKMTAAGSASSLGSGGINMYLGDLTLTGSGAQAIAHQGSSGNGLTITSNERTIFGGAQQTILGSSSTIQTFKNNEAIFFDGDTINDNKYLILNVGNGPTGSSKTLSLPVDSTGTVVASASTLAVTIQSSHASGVQVEQAKFVDEAITNGVGNGGSNFITWETVKFHDSAVSLITTLTCNSHVTNSGGNFLLTGSANQDITKSGGGDLVISTSHSSGTVYTHIEEWKFDDDDMDSSAASSFLKLYTVSLSSGTALSKSAGVAVTQSTRSGTLKTTVSGTITSFVIVAASGLSWDASAIITVDGTAVSAAVISSIAASNYFSDLSIDSDRTVSLEKLQCDENDCHYKDAIYVWTLAITSTAITAASGVAIDANGVTGFLHTALTGNGMTSVVLTTFRGSTVYADLTTAQNVQIGNFVLLGERINSLTKVKLTKTYTLTISSTAITAPVGSTVVHASVTGVLRVALTGSGMTKVIVACAPTVVFSTSNSIVVGGVTVTPSGVAGGSISDVIKMETVVIDDGAMSAVGTLGMSSHMTNSGGNALFTKSGAQAITKSGSGDLAISSSVSNGAVNVESFKFIEGVISGITGTTDLSIDARKVAIEKFQCADNACDNSDGTGNAIVVEGVSMTDQSITTVKSITMSIDLTNSGGDMKFTKNGDQSITKQTSGNFLISGPAAVCAEDWCFTAAAAASSSAHLTVDGASASVEKLKCIDRDCDHSVGTHVTDHYITIEDVKLLNSAVSGVSTLTMSGDLTNSAGGMYLTEGADQSITKQTGGDLLISGSAAVCAEDWCFTAGAAASSSAHLTVDGASVSVEKLKCIDGDCDHSGVGGSSHISIEVARMENQAISAVTHFTLKAPTLSTIASLYSIFIADNTIGETAGVTVTQGGNKGVLRSTLSGTVTSYQIVALSGLTWATNTDIVVGSTTISKSFYTLVYSTAQTFAAVAGSAVSQGTNSGTLRVATNAFTPVTSFVVLANNGLTFSPTASMTIGGLTPNLILYTVSLSSGTALSKSAGVAVTQSTRSGTLKTTVSGTITSFVIVAASGLSWDASAIITVDGTAVSAAVISSIAAGNLFSSVTAHHKNDDIDNTLTEANVDQAGYKYTVHLNTATTIGETAGVVVSQGALKGVLRVTLSGSVIIFEIVSIPGLAWSTGVDIVIGGTTLAHGKVSAIDVLGSLTTSGGNVLFTGTANSGATQDITKSGGGDLIIDAISDVKIESWEFASGDVTDIGSLALSMDGASAGIEMFQCAATTCYHGSNSNANSGTEYLQIENVRFLNSAISEVINFACTADITNSGGDILLTKNNGDQLMTKSGSSDWTFTNSGAGAFEISNWKFTGTVNVASTSDISIDAQTVRIENLVGDGNTFYNSDNANALSGTAGISLEDVTILNSGISGKSVALDKNYVNADATLIVSNTATQNSASLVSITGTASNNLGILAFKNVAGKIEIGASPVKLMMSENGVEQLVVNTATATLNDVANAAATMNVVGGIITVTGTTAAAKRCSNQLTLTNSKILSINTVVLMSLAKYVIAGSPAGSWSYGPHPSNTHGGRGIPHLVTGTVAAGSMKFWICNLHASAAINGNIEINFVVLSA